MYVMYMALSTEVDMFDWLYSPRYTSLKKRIALLTGVIPRPQLKSLQTEAELLRKALHPSGKFDPQRRFTD